MSIRSSTLLARKSLRARLGRTIAIAATVVVGVSFVVGSFVLADSLRATFDNLFAEVNEGIDLEIRSSVAFGDGAGANRDPVPLAVAETVRAVEGVDAVVPLVQGVAQIITADGELVSTGGAPTIGTSWAGDESIGGLVLRDGSFPAGRDQVAIDKATADRESIGVGERIEVITEIGRNPYTVSGLVGLGSTDGFAGASLALFDLDTALEVFDRGDRVDVIDLTVVSGADVDTVRAGVEAVLPDGLEVITSEQVAEETADAVGGFIDVFGTGLLIFAFITAFVSAFIINNVFAITIGQRLRELALLRAVGASARQVRRMIVVEAVVMSVIATAIGIVGGIGVARLIVALFNAAGLGFPDSGTVLAARTIIIAAIVGIGISVASVLIPARRAGRIPPVAALRPELGFAAINTRRLVGSAITTVIGAVAFIVGLFVRPGGSTGLAIFAGGGALLLFLGTASMSAAVARPVTAALGWPIAKLFGTPGVLARQNAGRAPRRTAASAAALMIGVALVSAAAVFAASLRDTFVRTLDRAVTADYVISDSSFQGLSPSVAETLRDLPELSAVSPFRAIPVEIDGETTTIGAVDGSAIEQLLNLRLVEGSFDGLVNGGLLVNEDRADGLGVGVGDPIEFMLANGDVNTLEIGGIYAESAVAGNLLMSIDTLESISQQPPRDFFLVARLADGVDPRLADQAVRASVADLPQVEVQTNAEFRRQQEDQINQLLIVITALLLFAITIAIVGISITLALSVFERTREIGLLRAVGMNRRQLRRTVRWEAVIVSVFGALVGIVLGTLIGIALANAVPDNIIDSVSFSPGITVVIVIAAVIAGLFAALYPSFKASKMNVLEAIATE